MISTEIYVEDYKLDLLQDISTEFTYTIDDITDFGSKNTSFSKTISLSGTAKNNQIFGFVFDLGNANFTDDSLPNVNYNFNASKSAQCRIFIDKIQIFKGTLRILEIVIEGKTIEYQCSVFGELGGFITSLANKKLTGNDNASDDLDFSNYDHLYTASNITNSWNYAGVNNAGVVGKGYYYPLIDYGEVSTGTYGTYKVDFQYTTFRPALYIKEYIDKMFEKTDYTYSSTFLNTPFFKRLIIPHNQKQLTKYTTLLLTLESTTEQDVNRTATNDSIIFQNKLGALFTVNATNTEFTYIGTNTFSVIMDVSITGRYRNSATNTFSISARKNGSLISGSSQSYGVGSGSINYNKTITTLISTGDIISFRVDSNGGVVVPPYFITLLTADVIVNNSVPTLVPLELNNSVSINDAIPKGIQQRDLFLSIAKMFNLYVYDDKWDDKKIYIEPYIDFYPSTSANALDWTNKIDRSKPLSIKPMSELNARYYHYKFKDDNDFYNENYRKKYNENYGDRIFDTNYDFSKDKSEVSLIFASSVLFQQVDTDKRYPAIYKLSNNNTKEDKMDSVIRIMQTQKIINVASWKIMNGATVLSTQTSYGYAGHLYSDTGDLSNPTNDINFGAPKELYISLTTYPTTNIFNVYHSDYMAEITDKNSKLLTCNALLDTNDILNLDFSKYIWIDGVLFRLNKVDGFNPMEYNTTKISLLKVIETTY